MNHTLPPLIADVIQQVLTPHHPQALRLRFMMGLKDPAPLDVISWIGRENIKIHAYTSVNYNGFMAYAGDNPDQAKYEGYGGTPYLALLDLCEAQIQRDDTGPSRYHNIAHAAECLAATGYRPIGFTGDASSWSWQDYVHYIGMWTGSPRIVRENGRWSARVGPNDTGVAVSARTREDALKALDKELEIVPIYRNGQRAKPGDLVHGKLGNPPVPMTGVVVAVDDSPGMNISVAFAHPKPLVDEGVAHTHSLTPIPAADEAVLRPYTSDMAPGLTPVAAHTWLVHTPAVPAGAAFWVGIMTDHVPARSFIPIGQAWGAIQ